MKRYDPILFDLDGTLTDPKEGITKSILHALSGLGIVENDIDVLVSFIGAPLFECLRTRYSLTEEETRRAVELYREYYSSTGLYENIVYPGIPELLEHLKNGGKTLLVATLKPTMFAERVLDHFDLRRHFDLVIGSDLDPTGIAKPHIIQRALSKLPDAPRERIIMVGDREHDVNGARINGIDSLAVTYGYGSLEELRSANPTYLADSVRDVEALLDQSA
jgi:phosphoglycolate phosphatase